MSNPFLLNASARPTPASCWCCRVAGPRPRWRWGRLVRPRARRSRRRRRPVEEVPAPTRESREEAQRQAREAARAALPEAKRLLLDSAKALNQSRSLRYNASYRVEGNLPVKLGSSEARVTMFKPEGQEYHWIMRATGRGTLKDGEPATPFDVTWFLDQTQIVDEGAKKVVVRSGRVNQPSVRVAEGVKLKEMFGPQPWNAELEGATLAMGPDEELGGVLCRVVDVGVYSEPADRSGVAGRGGSPPAPVCALCRGGEREVAVQRVDHRRVPGHGTEPGDLAGGRDGGGRLRVSRPSNW
jgi:hypothetical protein